MDYTRNEAGVCQYACERGLGAGFFGLPQDGEDDAEPEIPFVTR